MLGFACAPAVFLKPDYESAQTSTFAWAFFWPFLLLGSSGNGCWRVRLASWADLTASVVVDSFGNKWRLRDSYEVLSVDYSRSVGPACFCRSGSGAGGDSKRKWGRSLAHTGSSEPP